MDELRENMNELEISEKYQNYKELEIEFSKLKIKNKQHYTFKNVPVDKDGFWRYDDFAKVNNLPTLEEQLKLSETINNFKKNVYVPSSPKYNKN